MYSAMHPWDEDDLYPDDAPECDHLDYETDILTGFATCACGHRWMQTSEEIERERQRQIEYDKMCEQWARDDRSLANRLRRCISRVRSAWRRPTQADEIPF